MDRGVRSVQVDGYDVGDAFPDGRPAVFAPGTNVLVLGPSMAGLDDVATRLVAPDADRGEHAVVVAVSRSARRRIEGLDLAVPSRFHVVDCSRSGSVDDPGFGSVETVSSPADLTGIGIGMVKCTRTIGSEGRNGIRLGLLGLSTVLQYTTTERVFRFLHVMTGRSGAAGYLTVATLDSTAHDRATVNTLRALFDAVVELREADDGTREFRVTGEDRDLRRWRPFD